MSNERMFEVATRSAYRFPFNGMVSVEDLWTLPVSKLDLVFKALNSQLKQVKEESLLDVKSKQDEELDTKIEIVKYIVKVKLEEEAIRVNANAKREQKQKLLEILAAKQDENLQNKSIEEITAMINELDN